MPVNAAMNSAMGREDTPIRAIWVTTTPRQVRVSATDRSDRARKRPNWPNPAAVPSAVRPTHAVGVPRTALIGRKHRRRDSGLSTLLPAAATAGARGLHPAPLVPTDQNDGRARRGYLILAGITVVAVLIFNIDAVTDSTRDQIDLVALLPDASGVRVGTPVRVAGRDAGRVLGLAFLDAGDTVQIALRLRVDGEAATVLRRDSDVRAFRLRVIGQPIVQLEAGSALAPAVRDGDTLHGRPRASPDSLLAQARALPAAITSLLGSARQVRDLAAGRADDFAQLQVTIDAVRAEAGTLSHAADGGSLARMLEPGGMDAVRRLQDRLAQLADALEDARARYAPVAGSDGDAPPADAALPAAMDRLTTRVAGLQRDLDAFRARLAAGRGIVNRLPADSALQVALRTLQAQIDTVGQEAGSILLRMILP